MRTADLITDLTSRGIQLVAAGDKLRFHPMDLITPVDLDHLRQHKAAILDILRATPPQTVFTPAPIIPGTEHFGLYVDDADGHWPEFIPGHHYDIRQPSRLRGICSPHNQEHNS